MKKKSKYIYILYDDLYQNMAMYTSKKEAFESLNERQKYDDRWDARIFKLKSGQSLITEKRLSVMKRISKPLPRKPLPDFPEPGKERNMGWPDANW